MRPCPLSSTQGGRWLFFNCGAPDGVQTASVSVCRASARPAAGRQAPADFLLASPVTNILTLAYFRHIPQSHMSFQYDRAGTRKQHCSHWRAAVLRIDGQSRIIIGSAWGWLTQPHAHRPFVQFWLQFDWQACPNAPRQSIHPCIDDHQPASVLYRRRMWRAEPEMLL